MLLPSCYLKTSVFNHAQKDNINQVILNAQIVIVNAHHVLQQQFAHHVFLEEFYKILFVNHHAILNSTLILMLKHVLLV